MTLAQQRPLKLPKKPARVRAQSRALWNDARSPEQANFSTMGYEGRTTKDLFDRLQGAGVQCVVDIRYNPVSMYRPELSKGNLQRALDAIGIGYFHLREWGVPRDVRARAMETGTRDTIWRWYDEKSYRASLPQKFAPDFEFGTPRSDAVHGMRSVRMSPAFDLQCAGMPRVARV